jgi:PKHD-type hydroxylase
MQVFKVLNQEQIDLIRKKFEVLEWKDGRDTARGGAKKIKNNLQAYPEDPNFSSISEIVTNIIHNSLISSYVYPKNIVGLRANSYTAGQTYGWHVDLSHMGKSRTDMSFTIFISDPDSYEGGELEMTSLGMNLKVKPQAGEIVIYPTGILHQVAEVKSGTRLAIVGWIESFIPNDEAREALYKLSIMRGLVTSHVKSNTEISSDNAELITESYHQLVRILSA